MKYKLLSDAFLQKYKTMESPMEELGSFVYYRTYSRHLPDEGRREFWWETCARAVDYNCSLAPTDTSEAEALFHNMFHLKQFLSGRTLWVGGTEVAEKYPMSNFNCFSRDTKFLTDKGIRNFFDFDDGDTVKVLNGNGAWSESTLRNFGKQPLLRLNLHREGTRTKRVEFVTDDHLWFVSKYNDGHYSKIKTKHLSTGDRLRGKRRYEHQELQMCNIGIQHGMVYADGTYDKKKNHCRISLIGAKQKYATLFTTGNSCTEGVRDSRLIYGLPHTWKTLPDESYNVEYIKGFLYGLLLLDGNNGTSLKLSQSNGGAMSQIKSLFEYIGILTSEVKYNDRTNNNFGDYDGTFSLNVFKETVPADWVEFYNSSSETRPWIVDSVEETFREEDVWCVIEPKTHSFTLQGGLHTHNCAYQNMDNVEGMSQLLYLLLLGSGVGVGIKKVDAEKLPPFRSNYELFHEKYRGVLKNQRREHTSITFGEFRAFIDVGDSKTGWVDALAYYLDLISKPQFADITEIYLIYDNVRPQGESLKTFGGTASGHIALQTMIAKIDKVVKARITGDVNKLQPIDLLDMANIIGEGVVVGGVRRTAEIVLFDADDTDSIEAKSSLYTHNGNEWTINEEIIHRNMSNNSIWHTERPVRSLLHWQIEQMRYSGEPAFVNHGAGAKRRPNFEGVNPCGEILLDSKGMCNLTTVNVASFVRDTGSLDMVGLLKAQRLSARAGYRMTCVDFELPDWGAIQKRDRLLGCSLTGWQDMVNSVGLVPSQEAEILQELRRQAVKSAESYAEYMGLNAPLLVTTVKPEGTLSQLPTVSSGVHYSHSPYYIRRIRVSSSDPIVKVCEELGYPIKPEVGQDLETCITKVIEFPVKAPEGVTKYDVSAIKQLENYKMFMDNYVDHNCSITVHVRNDEWDEVEQWIWDNWDDVVAVSFLSLDENFYDLLPYEQIDEDEYLSRKAVMKAFDPSLISKYEII